MVHAPTAQLLGVHPGPAMAIFWASPTDPDAVPAPRAPFALQPRTSMLPAVHQAPSTGIHGSMAWFKGKFTGKPEGKPQIPWKNLWFPVDFPTNQSIEWSFTNSYHGLDF